MTVTLNQRGNLLDGRISPENSNRARASQRRGQPSSQDVVRFPSALVERCRADTYFDLEVSDGLLAVQMTNAKPRRCGPRSPASLRSSEAVGPSPLGFRRRRWHARSEASGRTLRGVRCLLRVTRPQNFSPPSTLISVTRPSVQDRSTSSTRPERPRRAGGDADRLRQVARLPAAGGDPARARRSSSRRSSR